MLDLTTAKSTPDMTVVSPALNPRTEKRNRYSFVRSSYPRTLQPDDPKKPTKSNDSQASDLSIPPKHRARRTEERRNPSEIGENVERARCTPISILQFLTDSFFPVGLTGKLFSSGGPTGCWTTTFEFRVYFRVASMPKKLAVFAREPCVPAPRTFGVDPRPRCLALLSADMPRAFPHVRPPL